MYSLFPFLLLDQVYNVPEDNRVSIFTPNEVQMVEANDTLRIHDIFQVWFEVLFDIIGISQPIVRSGEQADRCFHSTDVIKERGGLKQMKCIFISNSKHREEFKHGKH